MPKKHTISALVENHFGVLCRVSGLFSSRGFNIDGLSPAEAGLRLDEDFGVLCRIGLHCAPAAHRTLGTFPDGTLRLAPGPFTTDDELEQTLLAVRRLAKEAGA